MFSSLRGSPMSARSWRLRGRSATFVPSTSLLSDQQLHAGSCSPAAVAVVQVGLVGGPRAVHESRSKRGVRKSTSASGSLSLAELRGRVEGDVVVDELAEVGVARRHPRVGIGRFVGVNEPPGQRHERGAPGIAEPESVLRRKDRSEAVAGISAEGAARSRRALRQRLAERRGDAVLATDVVWGFVEAVGWPVKVPPRSPP